LGSLPSRQSLPRILIFSPPTQATPEFLPLPLFLFSPMLPVPSNIPLLNFFPFGFKQETNFPTPSFGLYAPLSFSHSGLLLAMFSKSRDEYPSVASPVSGFFYLQCGSPIGYFLFSRVRTPSPLTFSFFSFVLRFSGGGLPFYFLWPAPPKGGGLPATIDCSSVSLPRHYLGPHRWMVVLPSPSILFPLSIVASFHFTNRFYSQIPSLLSFTGGVSAYFRRSGSPFLPAGSRLFPCFVFLCRPCLRVRDVLFLSHPATRGHPILHCVFSFPFLSAMFTAPVPHCFTFP